MSPKTFLVMALLMHFLLACAKESWVDQVEGISFGNSVKLIEVEGIPWVTRPLGRPRRYIIELDEKYPPKVALAAVENSLRNQGFVHFSAGKETWNHGGLEIDGKVYCRHSWKGEWQDEKNILTLLIDYRFVCGSPESEMIAKATCALTVMNKKFRERELSKQEILERALKEHPDLKGKNIRVGD